MHHVDRVSNMVFIMMLSLQPNTLVKRLAALHWPLMYCYNIIAWQVSSNNLFQVVFEQQVKAQYVP